MTIYAFMRGGVVQLVRASNRKIAGSMPVLGITSLRPWEKHITLICAVLCEVWKTAQVSVSQRHIPEKKT